MPGMERSSGGARPTTGTARGLRTENLTAVANRLKSAMYVSDRTMPSEADTIAAIEATLRIPRLEGCPSEEWLASQSVGEDGMAMDPTFPPDSSSLFPDPHQPPADAMQSIVWRRVSGTLYFPTGRSARLIQGRLQNQAFLGALAAVAAKQDLLLDLIVSDDFAQMGLYSFQFYKHGCWHWVVVDNFLPCPEGEDRLAFACSANVGELWPSLLEKAYAKVHGAYYALDGGAVHETLVDLTGGVGYKINLTQPAHIARAADGSLWRDIQAWLASSSVVCVQMRDKERLRQHQRELQRQQRAGASATTGSNGSNGHHANNNGLDRRRSSQSSEDLADATANGSSNKAASTSLHGLLFNQVYSVLEAREIQLGSSSDSSNGSSRGQSSTKGNSGGSSTPQSVRLLRLQCPWPVGQWTGAWARGGEEWTRPEVVPHVASLESSLDDEATFWMSYEDFVKAFNRAYICRLFPPHWHQLTLHCGWQGPSAGGPFRLPPPPQPHSPQRISALPPSSSRAASPLPFEHSVLNGAGGGEDDEVAGRGSGSGRYPVQEAGSEQEDMHDGRGDDEADGEAFGEKAAAVAPVASVPLQPPSSTWCCNPQFRITLRKGAEVVVCLAQQDPQIEHRTHTPKRFRKRSIGMTVLRVAMEALGRRWEVKAGEALLEVPLSSAREVSCSFKAEADGAYIIVPHAGSVGEEGAFVLRTFSSAPLEMEQLPGPLSLVLGGHWTGFLAGGGPEHPTWGSNPQYMISCQQRAQVLISLTRLDLKYAISRPAHDPHACLKLILAVPDKSKDGMGRKSAILSTADIVAQAPADYNDETTLLITLEPESAYVLIPSLATPGMDAPFEVRMLSSVPVELVPLPEVKAIVYRGEWVTGNACGCDVNPLWRRNPRYVLRLSTTAKVRVMLTRMGRARSSRPHPVDDMVGFYVLRTSDAHGEIRGDVRKAMVAESTFVPGAETSEELELHGAIHYVVMPCTYAPGRLGRFALGVTCPVEYTFTPLALAA